MLSGDGVTFRVGRGGTFSVEGGRTCWVGRRGYDWCKVVTCFVWGCEACCIREGAVMQSLRYDINNFSVIVLRFYNSKCIHYFEIFRHAPYTHATRCNHTYASSDLCPRPGHASLQKMRGTLLFKLLYQTWIGK